MKFEKGRSGNPGGRPKEDPELKRLAQEHTAEALERLVFWLRSDNPKASVSAANAILDRGHGKPQQHVTGEFTHSYDAALEALLSGRGTEARDAGSAEPTSH